MTVKKLHQLAGLTLATFIGLHLFNHACSILGAEAHLSLMRTLRVVYRNPFAETLLMGAVLWQIGSGLQLFRAGRHRAASGFDRLQRASGLYLAIFFTIHLSAVWGGRLLLKLDTNFYFGVAGLNTFPANLFFIPYYGLAVLSFFAHLASAHRQKMTRPLFGLTPRQQGVVILTSGALLTILIFYGLTNGFHGVTIPEEYGVLIGR